MRDGDAISLEQRAQTHKVRFSLTLCSGSILSCFWFLLHFVVAKENEVDSEVVNYTGRMRLQTQHFGLLYLADHLALSTGSFTRFESRLLAPDLHATVDTIDNNCQALLGVVDSEGIPEIRDTVVKDALKRWMLAHLEPLRRSLRTSPRNITSDLLSDVLLTVSAATHAVDDVVDQASARAKMRVDIILGISIARVCFGVIWALFTGYFFGQLWFPYIQTYRKLQDAEVELKSLVRAAFDIVVPVGTNAPFEILGSQEELRHFLHCTSAATSVLGCACGPEEESQLEKFLTSSLGQLRFNEPDPEGDNESVWWLLRFWRRSKLEHCCWWRLFPEKRGGSLPVAPMIRTRLRTGPSDGALQGLSVELLVVSQARQHQKAALLAIRAVGDASFDFDQVPPLAAPTSNLSLPIYDLREQLEVDPRWSLTIPDGTTARTRSTSDTGDTAIGQLLAGTISPVSELELTPPPTVIGAGQPTVDGPNPTTRGGLQRHVTHGQAVDLARQLQQRLQAESLQSSSIVSM